MNGTTPQGSSIGQKAGRAISSVAAVHDGPLVSCLMVSRGDVFPAAFAVNCYRRQAYRNRELVIVTAASSSSLAGWVEQLGDPTIRCFEGVDGTLGDLRNFSVGEARGALICSWDDDDFYHRDRLSFQVAALAAGQAKGCFLERLLLWWPERRLLRVSRGRLWEGSILATRDAMPRYPSLPYAEDTPVTNALIAENDVVTFDQPLAYCYVAHGRNTNDSDHFEELFFGSTPVIGQAGPLEYDAAMQAISAHFPLKRYEAALVRRNRSSAPPARPRSNGPQIVSLGPDPSVARRLSRVLGPLRKLHLFDGLSTPHDGLVKLLEARFAGFLSPSNLVEQGQEDGFRKVLDSAFGVTIHGEFRVEVPLRTALGAVQGKFSLLLRRFLRLAKEPQTVFVRDAGAEGHREDHARRLRELLDDLVGPEARLLWLYRGTAPDWTLPGIMPFALPDAAASEEEVDAAWMSLIAGVRLIDAPASAR